MSLASTSYARGRPGRALPLHGKLATNLAGTAVVLVCIALPLLLLELSVSMEEARSDNYIEALFPSPNASPLAATAAMSEEPAPARPRLLDQHYYFVNGCVAAPQYCNNASSSHWGEYYERLRRLYGDAQLAVGEQTETFEEWAGQHTHFLFSQLAPAGAQDLVRALAENRDSTAIHLVGTSVGGASIFSYLSQAMRGEVPLDRRIQSLLVIDSPLGLQPPFTSDNIFDVLLNGLQASSIRSDVQIGIGEWIKAAGITTLILDTREDVVGHDPLPGIAIDTNPTYPQSDIPPVSAYLNCTALPCRVRYLMDFLDVGSTWHIFTGSHLADSAGQFIDVQWK